MNSNGGPRADSAASPCRAIYGGADVSYATLAEVFVILSAADASLGQIPQNQFGLLRSRL